MRILLIEDSPVDVELFRRVLKKSDLQFEFAHVATAPEMRAYLETNDPDVVVSDYSLPGFGALQALSILRERFPDTAFIVVSGAVGEETAVEVMRAGASDFVIKSALTRIPLVIDREIKESLVRKARRDAEVELRRSQEELKQALADAQAANQIKTFFLANMSHEIRTPIGAILGYVDLAAEQVGPSGTSTLAGYLKAIRRNGEQLLGLIGNVLDLTKIEADRLEIETLNVQLFDEIESTLLTLKPLAEKQGLELVVTLNKIQYPHLRTDPVRFKQILINVIGNAIKFSKHGQIQISVNQHLAGQGVQTTIRIKDCGIGMTTEQAKRLFEPFVQGDVTTARNFGGTGLGLALSRRLARKMGGELALVETSVGQGSTFEYTFHAERELSSLNAEVAPVSPADLDLSAFRILLVEDSADNQVIVSFYLQKSKIQLEVAETGHEAIEKVRLSKFDLILMDLQLPGLDGIQATDRLRKGGFTNPIVALTAHAFQGAREKALQEGFDSYLTKPIHRETLLQTLSSFLMTSRAP